MYLKTKPAQFAPVAPIQILEEMDIHTFGDYHLFLAHHTVEHGERFGELVRRHIGNMRLSPYRELNIIMDNSIVELGGAVDDQMIMDAVKLVHHGDHRTRVIPCLPDVMGSAVDTRELSAEAYDRWNVMGMNSISCQGYMLVTQAANPEELMKLVNWFFVENKDKYQHIKWVGIPRYMLKQGWVSRKWAIRYIQMVAPWVKIHLLGFSEDIVADMFDAREPGVQGIDSAVPVRYNGFITPNTTEEMIGPRGDWMEAGQLTPFGIENIRRVRGWVNRNLCMQNS